MTDTITPEAGKTYLTRDGRKARCICTERRDGKYPVVCLVAAGATETIETYTVGGRFHYDQSVAGFDLVSEAPRVVTVEVWVALTPDGKMIGINPTRYVPMHVGGTVVKITQDVELPTADSKEAVMSHWDDDPDYPIEDWQYEVVTRETRQGYAEWCASQRESDSND